MVESKNWVELLSSVDIMISNSKDVVKLRERFNHLVDEKDTLTSNDEASRTLLELLENTIREWENTTLLGSYSLSKDLIALGKVLPEIEGV